VIGVGTKRCSLNGDAEETSKFDCCKQLATLAKGKNIGREGPRSHLRSERAIGGAC
jgi:hypothetical protein